MIRLTPWLGVAAVVFAAGCGGGGGDAAEPYPTATAAPMVLTGSPLDNVGLDPTAVPHLAPEPAAADCEVHAENPESDCIADSHELVDGPAAVGFDDTLWSYEAEYPVWTNIDRPYPIEEVVETTVQVVRAELAGQDQGFFPHLTGRRTAPPYVRVGVYSVTVLFAADPENEPARVVVAVAGETAGGEVVDELVTYHWQWTPRRWVPEWESLLPAAPTPDPTNADPTPEAPAISIPDAAASASALCPPGFPYAHRNGKCYANPINPSDQLYPVDVTPEAVATPPADAPNALDVLPQPTPR